MNGHKRLSALALVLSAAILAAAVYLYLGAPRLVREQGIEPVEFLIGMSQPNLIEPWRITMNQDIQRAAARYGSIRVIFTNASEEARPENLGGKQRTQADDVRMLMGYGIDLLVISPSDREELRSVISEVYQKIPVIVLDRDVSGEEYTLFIGPDNYAIGKLAGEAVLRILGGEGGNVLEILGTDGSPPVAARSAGFADAISQHPGVVVVGQVAANWMQDQAEDRTKEFLISRSDIDVVFAQNDAMAYGAREAARKLRVMGIRYVGVDGLDGVNGGKQMVKDGMLDATFYCPTGGEQAIEYAIRILNGEKDLPRREILSPIEISKQ